MLFMILCRDNPGMADKRAELRPSHLEHVATYKDRIVLAGPLLDADGETPIGSLIVAEFPDAEAARRAAETDPYATNGLFASVEAAPMRLTLDPRRA